MGDCQELGKPSWYVTSHPGPLSLAIPLWVGTVSTVPVKARTYAGALRCALAPYSWSCSVKKRRSAAPSWSYGLGGTLRVFTLLIAVCCCGCGLDV